MADGETIAELDRRFGIKGTASVVAGNGGLAKVHVSCAEAVGEMYLHGAHVTSWHPRGAEEVIFVSAKSHWEQDRAIRGGIPVCFPWFAKKADDAAAPMHGFVRTSPWQLQSITQNENSVTVSMYTESSETTKKWWPADFRLVHRATFGAQLTCELVLTNTGKTPLRFEEALHTYFRIGQIQQTRLNGLDAIEYVDKTDSNRTKTQHGPLAIVGETDRIYLNTTHAVELNDQALNRQLRVAKEHSRTTVVWNPWAEKAKTIADFVESEWQQMVCIETCNVADFAVEVAPGQQHQMKLIVGVGPLAE